MLVTLPALCHNCNKAGKAAYWIEIAGDYIMGRPAVTHTVFAGPTCMIMTRRQCCRLACAVVALASERVEGRRSRTLMRLLFHIPLGHPSTERKAKQPALYSLPLSICNTIIRRWTIASKDLRWHVSNLLTGIVPVQFSQLKHLEPES